LRIPDEVVALDEPDDAADADVVIDLTAEESSEA
jgi:hypothetical protein